jgi:hypothetical protein
MRAFWRFGISCRFTSNWQSLHQWKYGPIGHPTNVSESHPSRTSRVTRDRLLLNLSDLERVLGTNPQKNT